MSADTYPIPFAWLLLVFQLPGKPAYLRVKTWRRLQQIGAVPIKNSVYALPANQESLEDFQWLYREIREGGGEALICESRLVEGLDDQGVRALFDRARDADYSEIAGEARALLDELGECHAEDEPSDWRGKAIRLRKRLEDVQRLDFFGAGGRETTEGLVKKLEERMQGDKREQPAEDSARPVAGSIWVTRQGVQVDRIASAWLIRRFLDPDMTLSFVDPRNYCHREGEIRFDMVEAEYTHEGEDCTFEVLLRRFGLQDPALRRIGEIVHDIDIKDGKFGREETAGVRSLLSGICRSCSEDEERVRRGSVLLDELYQHFNTSETRT